MEPVPGSSLRVLAWDGRHIGLSAGLQLEIHARLVYRMSSWPAGLSFARPFEGGGRAPLSSGRGQLI